MVFVARPLATAVATLGSGFEWREKTFLGWAGLRGAVPVVLATFPVLEDIQHDQDFFNIVFFAVLLSTLLQGTTIDLAARRLGVTSDEERQPERIIEVGRVRELGGDVVEHVIRPGDAAAGALLRDLGLPRDALVSLIVRGDEVLLPRGSTRVEEGDRLHVLVRREVRDQLPKILERWRTGPVARPVRPPRTYTGSVPVYSAAPVGRAGRRPGAPARAPRPGRRRAPAHAPRRPRRARHPRRRPLRGHRARCSWSARRASSRPRPAGGSTRPRDDAERSLVAGGHRRLRAVSAVSGPARAPRRSR